ncbi:MAG: DUF262 domain-containing HNH endonuclease family protein [Nitrospira sp.]|nr:DUF262 domain-containing HNH endonuclease family protein [Nitrospira sp.]MDH4245613.1 DUF262 domain-containing HNH endonuclease family protein [Nitrospira sp.]MDH4356935.1 DUF262 domain-containing HNH endonuclease family protein [Nitrospira sp.]MDH5318904.1 DUF262 domain-containing HNH endonuclease family protein [Nitrospira sp.]
MRKPAKTPIERLDARLDGIGHVLSDRTIIVPPYQRPYSWTDEHITDLLRDLSDAIRYKDTEYFLGTVVFTKNNEGAHFVIDGQQRLATVSIIICAIRNYFDCVNDKERADGIHQGYLARKELRGLTETAHLKLIAADNVFYEKEVLGRSAKTKSSTRKKMNPASHTRLENALRLATEHVNSIAKQTQEPAQVLLDWVEYIRDKAKVIVVEVNDEAGAYTIFEVLNDRGLDLSVSDLLKNFVFRIAEDKVGESQEHWTTMTAVLEASGAEEKDLRTFIRHVWASQYGLTREKELYDSIRKTITSKQRAVDFAKELSEQAAVYAGLANPSDEFWKHYGATVRQSIEALGILKAIQIRPLVLAILKRFNDKEVNRALPMLVCWTVRFLVVGKVGSGPLENGYSERAKEVSAGTIKTAKSLFTASMSFLASDDEFEQAFKTARVSANYLGRYYFRALEQTATSASTRELVINPSEESVTLEHIMPQAREPHWKHITAEQHKAYLKRIGNLALLDKDLNEYSGNLSFGEKKKALSKSQITLTQEIAESATWDVKAIDARQVRLAKLAVSTWPLKPF